MILAILQARTSSSRLPKKVMSPILGKPMLLLQIERVLRSKNLNHLIVATSNDPSDDVIERLCSDHEVACYRGSLNDVLDRFYQASLSYSPTHVVRLTGDCPVIDPTLIDQVIELHLKGGFDYTSNAVGECTYPDGLDIEIFTFKALETAWRNARSPQEREHVTPFIHSQPDQFKIGLQKNQVDLSALRWTVDCPQDLSLITEFYHALYSNNPNFGYEDILKLLERRPELSNINKNILRNEGAQISMKKESLQQRYSTSQSLLARALKSIPLGSQTFSKSKTQYPMGVSPYFIKKGMGSHVWDVDGNEYVDFVSGLCSINLGYNDPDVNAAVRSQLEDGVIFSLPHKVEMECAEKLIEVIPSAEMVRFGKNGSDATAGAIRLARAFTERDHVAACGYHGWQDWYIGATARNRGVPDATRKLTHLFNYNDLQSLQQIFTDFPGQIAAVIMEPMTMTLPKDDFLHKVKDLAHKNGAILIFDETVTGFRFAIGGAQELFGVTPDLSTFGKGLANGYPVSAVVGKADIMQLMEEVFFSFTFGGEALSLSAALATVKKIQNTPVIQKLQTQGQKILNGVQSIIASKEIEDFASICGHPSWTFFTLKDTAEYTSWQLKTFFLQEMFARGILTIGTHNMNYSHEDSDIEKLLSAYNEVLANLASVVRNRTLESALLCKPLEPLFKLR